jgi:hypothetical protein
MPPRCGSPPLPYFLLFTSLLAPTGLPTASMDTRNPCRGDPRSAHPRQPTASPLPYSLLAPAGRLLLTPAAPLASRRSFCCSRAAQLPSTCVRAIPCAERCNFVVNRGRGARHEAPLPGRCRPHQRVPSGTHSWYPSSVRFVRSV